MNFYLPTRDECQELIKTTEAFYCSTKTVEGQVVEMYDYRLAGYTDFFPEDGRNWTELRGLTFVQQEDGTWERNILLQKFFNINQTIGWMYDDVKDKKISRVQNKEDGSIISFVKFANGKVRAKSKMSFESDQAQMSQDIYETNKNIRIYVNYCLDKNLVPIFELVGYSNQIVLNYDVEKELILLQVRDGIDGEYFIKNDYEGLKEVKRRYHIKITEDFRLHGFAEMNILDSLLSLKETSQEDIEGWVVTFEDGQMAKIKTNKYLSLHGLIGPDAFRENLLVQTILDGNIDDVIAALVPGTKKDKLAELTSKVEHHFNVLVKEVLALSHLYVNNYNMDRKEFALQYKTHRMFSSFMKILHTTSENNAERAVRDYVLRQCKSLSGAQDYLKRL